MNKFEVISLIVQITIGIGVLIFGIAQWSINYRLVTIQDYVALAIIPGKENIKLLNTGKINLYIYGFKINKNMRTFKRGRLISSASLDSAYYWIPASYVPKESDDFSIKIYLMDEFGKKYITEGAGSSEKINEQKSSFIVWAYETIQLDWKF